MFGIDLFNECLELIKNKWKPKTYSDELGYKKDLRNFLFDELNKGDTFSGPRHINVRDESGISRCDLAVNRDVGIELKFGKDGKIKKSEIDRLYGQVGGHRKEYSQGVIIVLVGNVDKFSEADVRAKLQDISDLINPMGSLQQYPIKLVVNKPKNS